MKPFAMQPGLSGISRRFIRRQRPDVELLELFMKSIVYLLIFDHPDDGYKLVRKLTYLQ